MGILIGYGYGYDKRLFLASSGGSCVENWLLTTTGSIAGCNYFWIDEGNVWLDDIDGVVQVWTEAIM